MNSIHEEVGNFSREMETKKESNGNLRDKCDIKMKNFFNRFICRLDTAKERISKHKDRLIGIFPSKTQQRKMWSIQELWNNSQWSNIHVIWSKRKREKNETEKIFEDYGQEFYKINEDVQKPSSWINKTQIILQWWWRENIRAGREGHNSQFSLVFWTPWRISLRYHWYHYTDNLQLWPKDLPLVPASQPRETKWDYLSKTWDCISQRVSVNEKYYSCQMFSCGEERFFINFHCVYSIVKAL